MTREGKKRIPDNYNFALPGKDLEILGSSKLKAETEISDFQDIIYPDFQKATINLATIQETIFAID